MNRQMKMIEMLTEKEKLEVVMLSQELGVSEVTIRKDLSILEKKGLVRREKGYAILNETNEMSRRIATNYETKLQIAQKAAEQVKDGDTIMIESGSCCVLLAQVLADSKKDITIITNSVYIATNITEKRVKVILLGGEYQPGFMATVGPLTEKCAQEFHVNKIFVGTDGFSKESGFTGEDHIRVETLKAMVSRADRVMLLMEAYKAGSQGTVSFLHPLEIDSLFTEKSVSSKFVNMMCESHVNLYYI